MSFVKYQPSRACREDKEEFFSDLCESQKERKLVSPENKQNDINNIIKIK